MPRVQEPVGRRAVRWVTAALAGGSLVFAFAPFGYFWIAPCALAALFWLWQQSPNPASAARTGLVFGLAAFLASIHWIYISVHDFGLAPVPIAVLLTGGLVAIMAAYTALTGWLLARCFDLRSASARLGAMPAAVVFTEWCRGWLFSGFGWQSLGYSQTDSWLAGYAPVLGLHGMSWMVALSGGALLTLVLGSGRERLVAAGLLAAVWAGGLWLEQRSFTVPTGQTLRVALVQGAVPQDLKWLPEQLVPTMELYRRLTESAADAELVVWPEAAIPEYYERVAPYLRRVQETASASGSLVMLGVLRSHPESGNFQNAFVALTETPTFYLKRRLVPFGEFYPVPDFIREQMRLMNLPTLDAMPGEPEQPPLEVGGQRIAITICYEDVFGADQLHYMPEATLLVNVSNDAWFGTSIAPHQHLQIARLRAMEVGRYQLRATNTGITAIIGPRGDVSARLAQFRPGVLRGTVEGFTGATPYARFGNYPVVLGCLAALGLVLGAGRIRALRRPRRN